jgi:rod shape-determining protein MreD
MRWYIAVPVFFAAFIIQTTLLWRFTFAGYSPNLLLCMVVVFSFLYDERYGLWMGLIFGVLLDVTASWHFGAQTISFVLVYMIARPFARVFNHEWFLPQIFIAALATPVNAFLVWGVNRLGGSPLAVHFVFESLPALALMHCVLAVALHFIFVRSVIRHVNDRKYYREIMM